MSAKCINVNVQCKCSTNSDRKSANSLIKSVWFPGGLYIASTNVTGDLSLTRVSQDNVIHSTITSNELYLNPAL